MYDVVQITAQIDSVIHIESETLDLDPHLGLRSRIHYGLMKIRYEDLMKIMCLHCFPHDGDHMRINFSMYTYHFSLDEDHINV